jgi:hypothetical protein
MHSKPSPLLRPTTRPPAPDHETAVLAGLVARVLAWPCKKCGKTGICECYKPATLITESAHKADGRE